MPDTNSERFDPPAFPHADDMEERLLERQELVIESVPGAGAVMRFLANLAEIAEKRERE